MTGSHDLDAAEVARIVEAQFPALAPARVAFLGEGCDSRAFEINGEWIFRFPKRAEVEEQLSVETRILPVLAPLLSLPTPVFSFHGEPSPSHARRFAGYRKLPGTPAILVDHERTPFPSIAVAMGRFLSGLHAFPPADAGRLGLPRPTLGGLVKDISGEALAGFEIVSRAAPDAPLAKWRRYLEARPAVSPDAPWPPTVIHNDLAAEHVLLDPATLEVTGIIDWGDVAICDPTVDFAGLFRAGLRALEFAAGGGAA